MAKQSAGILLYRTKNGLAEVFLVHPGGPYFRNKDRGWWTIPKGEIQPGEQALETALREFKEETGYLPTGDFIALTAVIQKGGKVVHAWAVNGDLDENTITCNTFSLEWPPKSGQRVDFPEIDKAGWFSVIEAKEFINEQQKAFVDKLQDILPNS